MKETKILCIHGIGGQDKKISIQKRWKDEISKHLKSTNKDAIYFMRFDKCFTMQNANIKDYVILFYDIFLKKIEKKKTDQKLFQIKEWFDNYPDMVVEFLQDKGVRKVLRNKLKDCIIEHQPDIIYAHSLGTLICYDFFTQEENQTGYEHITLITSGSQLGNPNLSKHNVNNVPLQILPLKFWYNLHNPKDWVFANNSLSEYQDINNFKEINTEFSEALSLNHDAEDYIRNENTIKEVWSKLNS
jgi:hypothetical protein